MKDGGPPVAKAFDDELARQMKFLDYAPVLHISALHRRAGAEAARD